MDIQCQDSHRGKCPTDNSVHTSKMFKMTSELHVNVYNTNCSTYTVQYSNTEERGPCTVPKIIWNLVSNVPGIYSTYVMPYSTYTYIHKSKRININIYILYIVVRTIRTKQSDFIVGICDWEMLLSFCSWGGSEIKS